MRYGICTLVLSIVLIVSWGVLAAPAPTRLIQDHNFGCAVTPDKLETWNPAPMSVPRGVAGKFKLLKAIRAASDAGPSGCSRIPPSNVLIHAAEKGNVRWVDFVVATEDLKIYRAYSRGAFDCSETNPAQKLGAWWSFDRPQAKQVFRADNAVCNSWNDFSEQVVCTIKSGSP